MRANRILVAILVAASVLAGCSDVPTSPSSVAGPITGQLSGTWHLVAIQPRGQAEQPTPPGATYTVTFEDSRLSTRADCNTCGGPFSLSGQTLTAGPLLACTRAACATMTFEHTYTGLLGGDSLVTVSGYTLILTSARGVLRFTR